MSRKRIAFLCGQPEEYCQSLFIQGFNKVAFAADFDVCVFAMYQKYQDSMQREVGDASVFGIVNYNKFDAVVVMADSIQTPGLVEKIEDGLSTYGGKVLFIEGENTIFPNELQDNYHPIKKVISHLIEEHNLTDIAFLTGKSWHPHSKKRLQAFRDCMAEHGLEVPDNRVFYGDFWYTSGESVADRITKKNAKLPQAVACANDAMALGLAKALASKGYKIPEDIIIVGYDSNDEGKHAPVPLTSADIPIFDFGSHCAEDIISLLNGGQIKEFVSDSELFIGCSCGCKGDSIVPSFTLRKEWDTQTSESGIYSVFNHMTEDVVNQTSFTSLVNTIYSYSYLIKPFESFSLCINDDWQNKFVNFTDEMMQIIRCGSSGVNDSVNFDIKYDREMILPDLYEERNEPCVFFFLPFTYDDRVYGFTAVSYTDPMSFIDDTFRSFCRRCMVGFEVLRRSFEIVSGGDTIRDGLIKDNLTGLYNYQGLLSEGSFLISKMRNKGCYMSALALDVKDLSLINEKYGRAVGDKIIVSSASMIESVFRDNDSICSCLGNGEFIALRLSTTKSEEEMLMYYDKLKSKVEGYNNNGSINAKLFFYYGIETDCPETMSNLERLINTAISKKNANKISVTKAQELGLTEEEKERSIVVNEILDSNRLNYYFQPIVSAKDGEIYAYEALMRVDINPYIDPPTVIRYAALSERLSDVEFETFMNVIDVVEQRKDIFDSTKKVFINSIPGQRIPEDNLEDLKHRIKNLPGTVVIELTEQSELTDEELGRLSGIYSDMGVDTALDDYGTGYSNITNLLRYMPRYVKIDRMLLSEIQNSPQKQHFVKDIISFSHDNNIITLAEGVETSEELKTVIMLGVDLIQGFYTARPAPEIIKSIDEDIKREICEERAKFESSGNDSIFVAGREGRIMLPKLSEQGVEVISIGKDESTFIDLTISGSPELMTRIMLKISNGYKGRITLENVGFGSDASGPAISITEGSDVTLVCKGSNKLLEGIYVSEDSALHIEGDGDLTLNISSMEFFCIGAGPEKRHGDIFIEEYEGMLSINGNGVLGVGIGSGLGGNIIMNNAHIYVGTPGRTTVAIGNLKGDSNISINSCDINVMCRSMRCCGIGSQEGSADIKIANTMYYSNIDGRDAMFIGSFDMKSKPDITNTTINSTLKSAWVKGPEQAVNNVFFLNGTYMFDENGDFVPS